MSNSVQYYKVFPILRQEFKILLFSSQKVYITNLEETVTDKREFWKFITAKRKNNDKHSLTSSDLIPPPANLGRSTSLFKNRNVNALQFSAFAQPKRSNCGSDRHVWWKRHRGTTQVLPKGWNPPKKRNTTIHSQLCMYVKTLMQYNSPLI